MSTDDRRLGSAEVVMVALEKMDPQSRSRNDTTASVALTALHNAGWSVRPPARIFRAGDPEPGRDVRAVLDRNNQVWQESGGKWWITGCEVFWDWCDALLHAPLVEVTLPKVVTE